MNDIIPSNEEAGVIENVTNLPLDVLANHIFPFVGQEQYRFVGAVCKSFNQSYLMKFPEKTTHYKMSTMKHVKICWDETSEEGRSFLQLHAFRQTWYWYASIEHWDDENVALMLWTKSTFQCPWGALVAANVTNTQTCSIAARNGDLKVLQFARASGCSWDHKTCACAAGHGYLEILQWAHLNGCPWNEGTCQGAALHGHFEILKYAHENGCPWDESTCSNAAEHGDLKILKYAHENGCPWDSRTCSNSAVNGDLKMLQYARTSGCPWDDMTCFMAARYGHLKLLQYAHSNGCSWDESTCAEAARNGHLEILQWAHKNGCPWDEDTCAYAATSGHFEVWKYARDNGCPFSSVQIRIPPCRLYGTVRCVTVEFDETSNWDEIQRVISDFCSRVAH